MMRKFLPLIAFMLCCNGTALNAQYLSTREFLDKQSYIGGVPVDKSPHGTDDNASTLRSGGTIDFCYDENGDPYIPQGGSDDCDGTNSGDPGPTFPIGDSYLFWIFATALYSLKCFYKRKRNKVNE